MSLGPAPTRLRQIALVAKDIERAKQLITHVLGTEVVFEDPAVGQWGLKNFLVPIGGDFIEVVSPIKPGTTAGRFLERRGDGGYMIIMQTEDAKKRREHIEAKGLSRVIFEHDHGDSGTENPTPVQSRFSPWHACGPDVERYTASMKKTQHLTLQGCVLRLQPGDLDHEAAARQWEEIFGVARSRDLLAFTNARLGFIPGRKGQSEGLVSITIGVKGKSEYDAILERARNADLWNNGGVDMCGVRWHLALTGDGASQGKL